MKRSRLVTRAAWFALLTPLLLAAGHAGPVLAAAPAKVRLALVPNAGKPVRFVLEESREDSTEIEERARKLPGLDGALPRSSTVTREFSVEVGAVRKDGTLPVKVQFGLAVASYRSLTQGAVELRSDRPLPASPLERMRGKDLLALAHLEANGSVNSRGSGLTLAISEDAMKRRRSAMGITKKEPDTTLLSFATVDKWLSAALIGLPLPEGEVAAGDRWETASSMDCDLPASVLRSSSTARSIDNGEVSVESSGRLEMNSDPKFAKLGNIFGKITESTASSSFRLSVADGLPVAGRGEISWKHERGGKSSEATRTQSGKVTRTLRRVERWPSETEPAPKPGPPKTK
jgi:hypothetical protein